MLRKYFDLVLIVGWGIGKLTESRAWLYGSGQLEGDFVG
jgi:hypothetical protein